MNQELTSVVDHFDPETPMAVEFRRLVSRLQYKRTDMPMSPILVTSAQHSEGKTTTASFLAVTLAHQSDKRIAIVDLDLHRPRIHHMFGLPLKNGCTELIQGAGDAESVSKPTGLPNLSVVSAGTMVRSPASLFEPELIGTLLKKLTAHFDVVLLDSPPLLPVSDTMVIAPLAASVLYVVMAGKTPRDVVIRGRELLEDVDAKLTGVVLNNSKGVLPYYYNYKYYGYSN